MNNQISGGKRSTTDHIFTFVQDYQQARNKRQKMHAVFIDFEKAFNKVNHIYLIKKPHDLGMPEDLLNTTNKFLKNCLRLKQNKKPIQHNQRGRK